MWFFAIQRKEIIVQFTIQFEQFQDISLVFAPSLAILCGFTKQGCQALIIHLDATWISLSQNVLQNFQKKSRTKP